MPSIVFWRHLSLIDICIHPRKYFYETIYDLFIPLVRAKSPQAYCTGRHILADLIVREPKWHKTMPFLSKDLKDLKNC